MKIRNALIISLLLIFHLTVNYQILFKSRIIRASDDAALIHRGLIYRQVLFSGKINYDNSALKSIFSLKGETYHPPIYPLMQALSWEVLNIFDSNDEDLMLLLANAVFLIILFFSVYGIGSRLYNNSSGLLSVFLLSLYPIVFGHSRTGMPDFPLMSMCALSIFYIWEEVRF